MLQGGISIPKTLFYGVDNDTDLWGDRWQMSLILFTIKIDR
jgi:hypothetical protein